MGAGRCSGVVVGALRHAAVDVDDEIDLHRAARQNGPGAPIQGVITDAGVGGAGARGTRLVDRLTGEGEVGRQRVAEGDVGGICTARILDEDRVGSRAAGV